MNQLLDLREDTTTYETRKASYASIEATLGKRQQQIMESLQDIQSSCTAKELAVFMFDRGLTSSSERNATHPRLNELVKLGHVKIKGKRRCEYSGKLTTMYISNFVEEV